MSQFQIIADELKSAREQANLTIEFLSNKIKIDKKFLLLIEKGDFSFLPELYVKAFLRDFAKAVGLDEKSINKKYENIKAGKDTSIVNEDPSLQNSADTEINKSEIVEENNLSPVVIDPMNPEKKYFGVLSKYQTIFIGIIFLFLSAVVVNYILSDGEQKILEKPIEEIVKSNKERFEVNDDAVSPALFFTDSIALRLVAIDSTWIQLVRDGKDTLQRLLYPRQNFETTAKENFYLIVGNTTGLNLLLNNKPLNLQSVSKRRTEIFIDKSGIKSIK